MKKEKIAVGPRLRWGTWEELILASAVLRHGNKDWNVIASELRVRTVSFTPEACKAKYKDLRRRYSGCKAWFEELRKCRVKELKLQLEKSEETIGSLEAKLKRLKAVKEEDCEVDYDTSRTESPEPVPETMPNDFSAKETFKDSLSAGSFTQDFRSSSSPECRITELESTPEMETKPMALESDEHETLATIKLKDLMNEKGSTVRKRRGKRKRKDCNLEVREGSIVESEHFGSANVQTNSSWKETSTSGCVQVVKSSSVDGYNRGLFRGTSGSLMEFFSSIAESNHAMAFKRRLDSQKRARYKRIIRQHMDLDTIRLRIDSGTIKSIRELFRDLLLLANNALIFYSKRTHEYKSAFSLREFLMKEYRQQCKDSLDNVSSPIIHLSPMCSTPVRPRSYRPRPEKSKFSAKPTDTAGGVAGTLLGNKRVGDVSPSTTSLALQSSVVARKSPGAPQGYLKLRNADSSSAPLGSLVTTKKNAGISLGSKKFNNADSNLLKQSTLVAKKSFSHGKMVHANSNNHRSKTLAIKERKRAGQKMTGL